jgi:hypothetical protein
MTKKSIVILANSYKAGGRCVAGKEVFRQDDGSYKLSDTWIRPITSNTQNHGSVTSFHHRVDNRDLKLLDIVEIDCLQHSPDDGQPENWLINESEKWSIQAWFDPSVCTHLADSPADLWVDTMPHIKIHEVGLDYGTAGLIKNSLVFIKPSNFAIHLSNDRKPWAKNGKKDSKASFKYRGKNYNGFSVTDPMVRKFLESQYPDVGGDHVVAKLPEEEGYYICVSLSPIYGETPKHYKLVASVIKSLIPQK